MQGTYVSNAGSSGHTESSSAARKASAVGISACGTSRSKGSRGSVRRRHSPVVSCRARNAARTAAATASSVSVTVIHSASSRSSASSSANRSEVMDVRRESSFQSAASGGRIHASSTTEISRSALVPIPASSARPYDIAVVHEGQRRSDRKPRSGIERVRTRIGRSDYHARAHGHGRGNRQSLVPTRRYRIGFEVVILDVRRNGLIEDEGRLRTSKRSSAPRKTRRAYTRNRSIRCIAVRARRRQRSRAVRNSLKHRGNPSVRHRRNGESRPSSRGAAYGSGFRTVQKGSGQAS